MFNRNFARLCTSLLLGVLIFLATGCGSKLSENKSNPSGVNIGQSPVLENITKTKTLRVGTTGDFMPFTYKIDSTDSYGGIDIEMAHDLAKSLDAKVVFIKTSWPTLMTDLKDGKFDIGMSGITITPQRQQQAYFSIPVYSSGKVAITRDENVGIYTTIASINKGNVRVIVNPGGTNESFARTNFPEATIIQNDDNLSIFQKLVDGKADVMVTDAVETLIQERIHPELEAVNPEAPFNSFDFGYLLPQDSIYKTYIDHWLLMRKKSFVFDKIFTAELNKFH